MRTLAWTLAGIYLVGMGWMWWELKHAPMAKDCLPFSRKCAWCGHHMSVLDRELESEGALVTHGICNECEANLMGGEG